MLLNSNDNALYWLLISNMLQRTEARRLDIREIWARSNINDLARDKLKEVWKGAYERYMKKFISDFAKQLHEGDISSMTLKLPYVLEIRLAFA